MKYLDRMARRIGGRPYHSAISTTFAIEFAALEEAMLPQLMASGATNILVIADERMASMSLSDGSRLPSQLGRDYALASPPIADGLFHPKIVLQLGRKGGRLFVGSANVTAAGLAGNAEAVIEIECGDEPSPEGEIVRAAWSYLHALALDRSKSATDAINWTKDRAPWLRQKGEARPVTLEDGTVMAFLTNGGRAGIGQQFLDLVGDAPVEELVVVSPYWDEDLSALKFLQQQLHAENISVLLDVANVGFPVGAVRPPEVEFRQLPRRLTGRFAHAKIFIASTNEHDHVLVGSANCTAAALGTLGQSKSNAEACIYRRLPAGRAAEALGLEESLGQDSLDPEELIQLGQTPPIPLEDLKARRPGFFELDGDILTWTVPRGIPDRGFIRLTDGDQSVIDSIAYELGSQSSSLTFRITGGRRSAVSFATVEAGPFISNRAYVTQRSALRSRRREIATGSVAKAIEIFDANSDFELWMHQAADELARADLSEIADPSYSTSRATRSPRTETKEQETRFLTYEEFMKTRVPDERSEDRQNALTGKHSDRIRQFMNDLVGQSKPPLKEDATEGDDSWLDLGDENEDAHTEVGTQRAEASEGEHEDDSSHEIWVDAKQFEKMVALYVDRLTTGEEPLGAPDVLRVRFWLMMLLHKARTAYLPNGLEASTEERGWPRMAFRVISSFFCGKRPPVRRLMIAREYTSMPADFLECWATVLWTLDAIEAALPPSPKADKFLPFVRRVRAEVAKVLGLTAFELGSDTVVNLRQAMDRTLGAKLFVDVGVDVDVGVLSLAAQTEIVTGAKNGKQS
ncbi:hypothetical protein ELH22_37785 [Rhizobium ruizarguesonis]|uniref:hypothetical protein n=1 Tax=Rhizobium ruizarguesonis TaxID=2081791 RepID=UPI0010318FBB|nr:hypothetical protein [Rhizobium ruizarguesonis]TBD50457.1 hypothetical protein ELH22_37785 [Rhizobium ruizarguesonis]